MNKRIQQLAEQASEIDGDDLLYYHPVFAEKFAELIVRECINKIETYHIPVGNSAAGEIACGMTYDALKEIRDDIKQHFGVET